MRFTAGVVHGVYSVGVIIGGLARLLRMQSDKGGRVGQMLNDAVDVGGLSSVIAVRGMASAVLNLA